MIASLILSAALAQCPSGQCPQPGGYAPVQTYSPAPGITVAQTVSYAAPAYQPAAYAAPYAHAYVPPPAPHKARRGLFARCCRKAHRACHR